MESSYLRHMLAQDQLLLSHPVPQVVFEFTLCSPGDDTGAFRASNMPRCLHYQKQKVME